MRYPNVLMLGNGLNRCFTGGSWDSLIRKLAVRDDLPAHMELTFPLQIILATNGHVSAGMKAVKDDLWGSVPDGEYLQMLQSMLASGFDDILTTNYSYELERAALDGKELTESRLKAMSAHTAAVERVEPQYLLHSYNRVMYGEQENRVWHIHGEARKPEGMIIGHYYYANLLAKMKEFSDDRGSDYQQCAAQGIDVPLEGWLDSFILGNIYVLGFGFDQSEFDLWWLLNRKQREKAPHGKLYFYEPDAGKQFDEKHELLKLMDAEICDLGVKLSDDAGTRNQQYHDFYQMALEDILKKKVGDKQNG